MKWNYVNNDILFGLRMLPDCSVHCIVTSPPYWSLRDYKVPGQLGLETSFAAYLANMVLVFREVRRVLRDDGTLWLNMGDCYARDPGKGVKFEAKTPKTYMLNRQAEEENVGIETELEDGNLLGQPWRLAFALQDDGWILRQEVIWYKNNPMPESVKSRPVRAHESIFQFTKNLGSYYYDHEAVKVPASPNTHLRISRAQSESMRRLSDDAEETTRREPHGLHAPRPNIAKPSGWFSGAGRHDQVREGNYGNRSGYGKVAGKNSRMRVDQDPAHLERENNNGVGWGYAPQPGVHPKARTVNMNQRNGHRPRQNPSYSAAVVEKVATRALRSVWTFATQALAWTICKTCERTYDRAGFKSLKRAGDAVFCECGADDWHGHFASFPEKLPETCILASTPEIGCCAACMTPWKRVVDVVYENDTTTSGRPAEGNRGKRTEGHEDEVMGYAVRTRRVSKTVAWTADCDCGTEERVPAIVLDPFAGAATTGLMALRLGRSFFGIEISRLYWLLGTDRIMAWQPLLTRAAFDLNFLLDRQQQLT